MEDIMRDVTQGDATLGPLLFNSFINDIFMFIEKSEIFNFADNNTVHDCSQDSSSITGN